MTPNDFIYWLQGYFEIPEHKQSAELTVEQVKVVRRHLAMLPVAKYDKSKLFAPSYGKNFCNWLDEYLKESEYEHSAARTFKIQQRLGELFEHVSNTSNY